MSDRRTENDSWDITGGVGETALGMAVARARETAQDTPLFADPYARLFIDEAVRAGWHAPATAAPPPRRTEAASWFEARTQALLNYAACRTVHFDQFFLRANRAGISQVVVLGAGLDSRPWRLPWSPDTLVYEIDQPQVLEFKVSTLWAHNAEPVCDYRPVSVDLRSDWPEALWRTGFDPTRPTAWSVEGLLSYLPRAARSLLFDRIHTQSSPGSRVAVEAASAAPLDATTIDRRRAVLRQTREAELAADTTTLRDVRALWFPDRGDNFADWLMTRGWTVTSVEANDLMDRYGRAADAEAAHALPHSVFLNGCRP